MSRQNIDIPIYALTPTAATKRRLALYRNVTSYELVRSGERDTVLKAAEKLLLAKDAVQVGDLAVMTWGEPLGKTGATNAQKIMKTESE